MHQFAAFDGRRFFFKALYKLKLTDALFEFEQLRFSSLYKIAYSLTGYTLVFGNFGKRKVVIIVTVEYSKLLFGKKNSVTVEQFGNV